jgi:LuxR family transcriptional regulator, maltose regulon positive regulatory protein
VCWPTILQAEVLREWNRLDKALELVEEAILLSRQTLTITSITYVVYGYVILMRIALSRGELDRAHSALQEFERTRINMNQPLAIHYHSLFTTVDQVRLWLACGERNRALRWAEELDWGGRCGTPFAREREEVAYARVRLATQQPVLALQRLESVLQRATAGQRWGHVIEIRLLQALAYQMCHETSQALEVLSEAVRLAEPEGFIRSFMEEGAPMAALLCHLQQEQRKAGPTPYLDTLLAAFPQKSQMHENQLKQAAERTTFQSLLDSLSERELEVLQLLIKGASNQEIAQTLAIAVNTVKCHISHIFSKLGVQNRMQARELSLLDEKHRAFSCILGQSSIEGVL